MTTEELQKRIMQYWDQADAARLEGRHLAASRWEALIHWERDRLHQRTQQQ